MRSRLKAYLQLVRLPNAFTAVADVTAGFLASGGLGGALGQFPLIAGASACLYSGGIVLNDLCDVEVDRRERPNRPLPSGRIGWERARALAIALLLAGLAASFLVTAASGAVAALLVSLIVLYNTWAKHFPVRGPLCMGACRFANVVLGSTAASTAQSPPWIPALLIGSLVVAATILSRDEVGGEKRRGLLGALLGLAVIAVLAASWIHAGGRNIWGWLFLAAFLSFTVPVLMRAWRAPTPRAIQHGVKQLVLGIIPMDAVVAAGAAGPLAGFAVLGLLIPSWLIARWIYVT